MKGNNKNLTFGFDIGIASVGWAVLTPDRIVALGVRAFDKAETAKEGESLNLARRSARLMRRRLYRRAWRQTKVARLLKREGLITDARLFHDQRPAPVSPWQLRVDGLDRLLAPEEWARVIYHLCKHRGFHWISRAEAKKADEDTKGEGGKVKQGLAATTNKMRAKGYRTAAEMVLAEFPDAQRNKQGDYGKALSRILLAEEVGLLFERQRTLGNPHTGEDFQSAMLGNGDHKSGIFWLQKPALSGAGLLKMLGRCTLERDEYRTPKASFTAERHVWLTRLNNLRIVVDGETRPLNTREREIALPLPYQRAGDFKHEYLRAALTKAGVLDASFRFAKFTYAQTQEGKEKDPESEVLVKLPAWQEIRKQLKDKGLETEWQGMAGAALAGNPNLLDQIPWVLSVYKDDTEVELELGKIGLPGGQAMIDALCELRFDKFSALSLKALRRIVPHMETGLRYDEACVVAGYHHSQFNKPDTEKERYLPPFYENRRGKGPGQEGRMIFSERVERDISGGIPRNPVVLRALNQARKVMNALIREYGSPASVHVEMARDLSRPMNERSKVKKMQDEYRERNDRIKATFATEFGIPAKSREFEKFQLYTEQYGKCAYSLEALDLHRVLHDIGYAEVDHVLPYSRSYDDSKNNKVLVLAKENRNKGNATPYEYLGGASDSERWRRFAAWVEGNKSYRLAKRTRLLRKNFGEEEAEGFRERNLNDTRYICKFFKNYVERYLKLADESESKRCVVLSGQLTAFLRARWGLTKIRSDSDRHHAMDAVVVAACSHGMVKRLSDYSRRRELESVRDGFVDPATGEIVSPAMFDQLERHFPTPWNAFRHELETRLLTDESAQLRADIERLGTHAPEMLDALKPLFVSRAPQRRNGGAAHKDTIYAQPDRLKMQGGVTQKIPLANLTLADFGEPGNDAKPCRLIDPHRNEKLYAAIRARLEAHGGKGDKAFPASNPLRKPDRDGNPTGPIVRTVTKVIDKQSGIPIRGGMAKNDTMLRVDVFTKGGKFHLVPVYVHHRVKGLPDRAIVAFKDEAEWTLIDESFAFCFSLYSNDLIKVTQRSGEKIYGYYRSCHSGTAAINIALHDRYAFGEKTTSLAFHRKNPSKPIPNDKLGLIEGVGVKLAANIEKFHVDVLGNLYPAPPEKRRDLA